MELKITKEKVLDAAAKCSTAKTVLSTLFPEAFTDEKSWDIFVDELANLLNSSSKARNFLYSEIPGSYSVDKAEWVVSLIRKNLNNG